MIAQDFSSDVYEWNLRLRWLFMAIKAGYDIATLFIYLFHFYFWLHPQHVEDPGPEIKPALQQRPESLQ